MLETDRAKMTGGPYWWLVDRNGKTSETVAGPFRTEKEALPR